MEVPLRYFDNRDMPPKGYIYVVWDGELCLYIGQTTASVKQRFLEHVKANDPLGLYVTRMKTIEGLHISAYPPSACGYAVDNYIGQKCEPDLINLVTAERCMIHFHNPKLNIYRHFQVISRLVSRVTRQKTQP